MSVLFGGSGSGHTARITLTPGVTFPSASALTLMLCYRIADPLQNFGGLWGIGDKDVTNNLLGHYCRTSDSNLRWNLNANGNGISNLIDQALTLDVWHWVCMVKGATSGGATSGVSYHLQDVEAGGTPTAVPWSGGEWADTFDLLALGDVPDVFAGEEPNARISVVKAWLAELSAGEVLAETLQRAAVRTADLVGEWKDGEHNTAAGGWSDFTLAGGATQDAAEPDIPDTLAVDASPLANSGRNTALVYRARRAAQRR